MEGLLVVILVIGLALIDGKMWRIMGAQKRHHEKVEALLREIRDGLQKNS